MLERQDQSKGKRFRPDFIADSVATIDFNFLKKRGVKAILIDLDGTVVERGKYVVSNPISQSLKKQSLDIYIATNRPKSRDLKDLKERLHAKDVIHPHGLRGKPLASYYRDSIKTLGLKADQVAMIGDRYIQDIYGANRAGLVTVLVKKLDKPVNWFDRQISGREKRRTEHLLKIYRPIK